MPGGAWNRHRRLTVEHRVRRSGPTGSCSQRSRSILGRPSATQLFGPQLLLGQCRRTFLSGRCDGVLLWCYLFRHKHGQRLRPLLPPLLHLVTEGRILWALFSKEENGYTTCLAPGKPDHDRTVHFLGASGTTSRSNSVSWYTRKERASQGVTNPTVLRS